MIGVLTLDEFEDRYIDIAGAMEVLNVSRRTIYRLIDAGKLKAYTLPGIRGFRFLYSEVMEVPEPHTPKLDAGDGDDGNE